MFTYKAKSSEGKMIKGNVESKNKETVVRELGQDELVVYSVEPVNDILSREFYIGNPINKKDFVIFVRQFATLIQSGILLLDAIKLLADQTENKYFSEALEQIAEDIQEGKSLSSGMEEYPKIFPVLFVRMVKSGEVSGQLEAVLNRMANYYEKQYNLQQKISSALTYPMVVGAFAIVVLIFMLVFIVPSFAETYASQGQELPLITQIVLGASGFVQNYWWVLVLIVILLVVVYQQMRKNEKGDYYLDYFILKMPIIGPFIQKTALARMTQTLSSLLGSSVPILQAIEVTSAVVGNRVIEDGLLEARDSLAKGESLDKPLEENWVFPTLITQMIRVGEESGSLDQMLNKVADIYDQEVNEASDKLESLIEPVLIIFLSVIVGIIVMSIVIPMFGVYENY